MQSRAFPSLSKRPEIRIPAWRQLYIKRWFWQSRVLPILSKRPEIRIPAWRQLSKRRFCESRALPILSKRPEIRIPAWRQLSKRRFSTRCSPKCYFVLKYAKPCASDSLKETRDKDSSLAAALKTAIFNQMLSKVFFKLSIQSRAFPIHSKRFEIRIPAWPQL